MTIAINARFLQKKYLEGYGNFTLQVILQLATQLPQHNYIIILDQAYDLEDQLPTNCKVVTCTPKTRHPFITHYWLNFKIPSILKKYKASIFISLDGFLCLRTKLPQILCIHDLAFLHYPKAIGKIDNWYYKKFTPKFVKKAAYIFTVSEFSKKDIVKNYPAASTKIDVVYNGVKPIFLPLPWQQQNLVREKYTNDKMYFLYCGSVHPRKNVISLLKAFSIFKKWQQSDMQLIITGRMAWKNDAFMKLFASYKYKNDVVLLKYMPHTELAPIMASAYAFVYPSLFEGFGVPIIEAMQCGIPVLTSNNSGMLEAGGKAALFFDPNNIKDIAEKMQLIYKDENIRINLKMEAIQHAEKFKWEKTVQPLIRLLKSYE